jgi:hypothetical protein
MVPEREQFLTMLLKEMISEQWNIVYAAAAAMTSN